MFLLETAPVRDSRDTIVFSVNVYSQLDQNFACSCLNSVVFIATPVSATCRKLTKRCAKKLLISVVHVCCGDPVSQKNVVCGVLRRLFVEILLSFEEILRSFVENVIFESKILISKDIKYTAFFRLLFHIPCISVLSYTKICIWVIPY